jgi:hypothetical protein
VRWFELDHIGAVAGNAKVGNRVNLVTRWQAVEYVTAQNIERRALTRFDAIMVVPGAVGAWRRSALERRRRLSRRHAGRGPGPDHRHPAQGLEDRLRRGRGGVDRSARNAARAGQAAFPLGVRHAQCLWKHRAILREQHPSGLAFVGMPQAWLFQILFALISPLIDLALGISIVGTIVRVMQHGWDQTQTDVLRMGIYWIGFTTVDLLCGWIAYRLDVREAVPGAAAADATLRLSPVDVWRGDPRGGRGHGRAGHRLGQAGTDWPRQRRPVGHRCRSGPGRSARSAFSAGAAG